MDLSAFMYSSSVFLSIYNIIPIWRGIIQIEKLTLARIVLKRLQRYKTQVMHTTRNGKSILLFFPFIFPYKLL